MYQLKRNENIMEKYYAQIETGKFIYIGESDTFDGACNLADEVCPDNDVLWIYSHLGLVEHYDNIKEALGIK